MEKVINELTGIVKTYSEKFSAIPEPEFSKKPLPHKWSKKEVVGHLIDSGQNNLRRFITGQYEASPPRIIYEQDFWVKANDYHNMPSADVISLWTLVNQQICSALRTMPPTNLSRHVDTGDHEEQLRTLEWLANDYVRHMKHHINQVIPNSYVITYP